MSKSKKFSKRDRSGSIFLTLPPEMAAKLRKVCLNEHRSPSQQITLWLEPHLS